MSTVHASAFYTQPSTDRLVIAIEYDEDNEVGSVSDYYRQRFRGAKEVEISGTMVHSSGEGTSPVEAGVTP